MAGLVLVLVSLLMALVGAHLSRMRRWDRPRWALGRGYSLVWTRARLLSMASGLALLLGRSMVMALGVGGFLAAGWIFLAWVRSETCAIRQLRKELEGGASGESAAESRAGLLRGRHPDWGEDLVARMVEDHPDAESLARIVVRMERAWK